jgi:hypothetical protein
MLRQSQRGKLQRISAGPAPLRGNVFFTPLIRYMPRTLIFFVPFSLVDSCHYTSDIVY